MILKNMENYKMETKSGKFHSAGLCLCCDNKHCIILIKQRRNEVKYEQRLQI